MKKAPGGRGNQGMLDHRRQEREWRDNHNGSKDIMVSRHNKAPFGALMLDRSGDLSIS